MNELVKSKEVRKPEGEGGNVREDQQRNDQGKNEGKGGHVEIQGNGRGYGTDRQSATFLYRKKTSSV